MSVAAQILIQLGQPTTVSQTWGRLQEWRAANNHHQPITFGWFVLALDVLYMLGVVWLDGEVLNRKSVS